MIHEDDIAIEKFCKAMSEKMKKSRQKGRSGWQECDPDIFSAMLREHIEKGDPLDVANFCMMLWNIGVPISDTRASYHGKIKFKTYDAFIDATKQVTLDSDLFEHKMRDQLDKK